MANCFFFELAPRDRNMKVKSFGRWFWNPEIWEILLVQPVVMKSTQCARSNIKTLISLHLNSKLFRFHCVRPNVHTRPSTYYNALHWREVYWLKQFGTNWASNVLKLILMENIFLSYLLKNYVYFVRPFEEKSEK